ncbi:RluA family pseudouridine synthase [Clostridium nigeriense]|uniref:RluA family pseudouridine synthase n=1 Tax=Clostridium nigeriense TaxID=1805470 RepID=UPI003D348CCF
MSTIKKVVTREYDGRKIREYLKEELGLSSRLIRSASVDKRIFVNNKAVKMNYIVKDKDNILINLMKDETQNIDPENIPIDIVYEDEDIIVVNKGPNMVVHPTKRHQSGTLANALMYYFKESNQKCIVRLVSRLDMDTSGLIIIAKNQYAHMELSKEMTLNNVEKRYLAVVHGHMENMEGTIDLPIYRPEEEGTIRRVVDERGQRSITHYKVVERYKNSDLVECLLETGRTHQIRVHLSHLGNPIWGDTLYGSEDDIHIIKRQALHAYGLDFKSPRTKEPLCLRAKLPEDINKLVKELENR